MTTARRLWAALWPGMTIPFIAALFYFVILSENPVSRAVYTGVKIFLLAWPPIAVRWILRERFPVPDLRAPSHRRALPGGLLVGALMAAVILGAMATPLGRIVARSADSIRLKTEQLGVLNGYVPFAVFLSLVHSLMEEYFWRWFVFGNLRRVLARNSALVLANVAFASHHAIIVTQFFPLGWGLLLAAGIGLAGVAWCLMYERQGTLCGAWLAHTLADAAV
ncbi:MAG: CPBP family intramembrane metalloprotease, partial [Kiritimatiellae bacterium]|nr:CPBP family intramembrane metalloprotease [Kiritimatiellia bacterium]